MAGGEDLMFPYLNSWLRGDKNPDVNMNKLLTLLDSGQHTVPQGDKELAGSQNLFLLKAGCERALGGNRAEQPSNTDEQLIARLERERDDIGLWGSEQTSPIYHHFIITGLGTVAITTSNTTLKYLARENLASFFWYVVKMGLGESKHGLVGQRGAGHNFTDSGFPYLHFITSYFLGGRPERHTEMGSWKNWFQDSGWVMASLKGGKLYAFMKEVWELVVDPHFVPWRLRVATHFFRDNVGPLGTLMEKGINNNTPDVGGYIRGGKYLPVNERIRVRQQASKGEYGWSILEDIELLVPSGVGLSKPTLLFSYTGIYQNLEGGGNQVISAPVQGKLQMLTSSLSGVTGWEDVVKVPQDPVAEPTPPGQPYPGTNPFPPPTPDTRSFVQKLWDMLRKVW